MKGIFLDYTGTMVREDGEDSQELVRYFLQHSRIKDPRQAVALVWKLIKEYEAQSYGEGFLTEDEIIEKIMDDCARDYGLAGDRARMHGIWQRTWVHAPLFDDAARLFERCPLPIYVITNDGLRYIQASMAEKGLRPAGIVSAETVRAYKPHKEIFEEALRVSGLGREDAVHLGDSLASDVKGAQAAGIRPILVDRAGQAVCPGVQVIRSLDERVF